MTAATRAHEIEIEGEPFLIEDAQQEDIAYIFPTWMEAARELHQQRKNVRLSVFNAYYPDYVQWMIQSKPIKVARWKRGGGALHAWACGRGPNVLHFAYVPFKLRGKGLGRAMVQAVLGGYPRSVWVTAAPLSLPHHPRFVYNPFLGVIT